MNLKSLHILLVEDSVEDARLVVRHIEQAVYLHSECSNVMISTKLYERFFLPFCALYLALTLVLNLSWMLGWRGIEPPMRTRKPEASGPDTSLSDH